MTDVDKAIRAAKLTLGAVMDKRRAQTAKDRAGGQIAPSKYLPGVPRQFHADGGVVKSTAMAFDDLHPETQMDIMSHLAENIPELSEETAGGSRPEWLSPHMKDLTDPLIVNKRMAPIGSIEGYNRKPSDLAVARYAGMLSTSEAPPILVDGNQFVDGGHRYAAYKAAGRKTIPVVDIGPLLRMNWSSWLDGDTDDTHPVKSRLHKADGGDATMTPAQIKAQMELSEDGGQKAQDTLDAISSAGRIGSAAGRLSGIPLGGIFGRRVAEEIAAQGYADGGSVADRSPMFEGMHQDLRDETGQPIDLYHGTPGQPFEAFDDTKLGSRDAGFYGRGHYLTPIKGNAEGYADPDEMGRGSVMGPMHAALKNPFIWDVSDDEKSHRTLKDLHSMGIMRDRSELRSWDNLQRHEINRFMDHMKQRGHDGVIMKSYYGPQEIVVFNPNMIKHRDAEVGDPNDPRIMRADGGKVDLYSKAAQIIRGMKDQKMDVADILKYAEGKGAKRSELTHVDVPPGKATPSQVAEHIEFMQPQVGVHKRETFYRYNDPERYERQIDYLERQGRHDEAEELTREFEAFEGYGGKDAPLYAKYQLPGGENYREHVLTLDNHPDDQTYMAKMHWGRLANPLAHIRMSDRIIGNKKILHIEEMQSDWNSDARKSGFRTGREKQDYDDYVAKMREDAINGIDQNASPMIRDALRQKYSAMDPYMLAMKMGRQPEHASLANRAFMGSKLPPRAPYINPKKDEWAELAMKHVLTEAAKGGYDGIAFTPDEAQSERWGGTKFDGIYNKKLPGIAQRLVQQHDPDTDTDDMTRLNEWAVPMIPLSDKARDSITQNSFPSFRRGGYVTHVRRAR